MTSRGEMKRMNRLVDIIRKNGSINKIQLVIASGISNSYYEKLKPYLLAMFHDIVYDKTTQIWSVIKTEDIDNEIRNSSKTASIGTENDGIF